MADNYQIDDLDRQILTIMLEDALLPFTEIAKRVFVSPGTVHVRYRKLMEMGVISGSQIVIDHKVLGFGINAFIGIYLEKSSMYASVLQQLKKIPEVIGCHYTTGNYSMFANILCKDTDHLKVVLHDKMQYIDGISRTETLISLEQSIDRPLNLLNEHIQNMMGS